MVLKHGITEEEYLSLSPLERIKLGMGRTSTLSTEQLEDITRRLRNGEARKDVAEIYGITPQRLSQIARQIGVEMRAQSKGCELIPVGTMSVRFSEEGWEWIHKQTNVSDAIDKAIKFYIKNHKK